MARIKEIIVGRSVTYNIGDWESIKPTYSEVWTVEPGDDPAVIRKQAMQSVSIVYRKVCQREIAAVVARRVNQRDPQGEDYLDEICDYFDVPQTGRFTDGNPKK